MNWWLYPKQNEFKHDFPTIGVCVVYVLVVIVCIGIRAVTWPGNKHVDSSFLVDAVAIPVAAVTFLVQAFCMAYNANRHYIETRLLIAARQEYKVASYARSNIILAGWSVLTPPKATKELALNMLKLEGEFPLAAKMPLKIELDKSFDFTRAGQAIIHVLEPMMEKLSRYRQIEALVWVRDGDESCAQGDQFVAASEQKKFSVTAVSSRLTHQPDYPEEKMYTPPWASAGISGMMLFFAVILTLCSFSGNEGKDISGWFLVILFVICTGLMTAAGVFITWLHGDKAYQHMGM